MYMQAPLEANKIQTPKKKKKKSCTSKRFSSIDPAPSIDEERMTISELRDLLVDPNRPLFDRYKAMFALRNIGTDDAVRALCDGLADDSALFKHEIAFVLGQMQNADSTLSLKKVWLLSPHLLPHTHKKKNN